jgi:hypothetical protein
LVAFQTESVQAVAACEVADPTLLPGVERRLNPAREAVVAPFVAGMMLWAW